MCPLRGWSCPLSRGGCLQGRATGSRRWGSRGRIPLCPVLYGALDTWLRLSGWAQQRAVRAVSAPVQAPPLAIPGGGSSCLAIPMVTADGPAVPRQQHPPALSTHNRVQPRRRGRELVLLGPLHPLVHITLGTAQRCSRGWRSLAAPESPPPGCSLAQRLPQLTIGG